MKEALGNENVDFGKVISMIEKRVSLFQQEQADDDDKQTFGLISSGRAEDGDTSLAIDVKGHEGAFADPTEQLTGSEAPRVAAQHRSTQQHNNCHRKQRGRAEREKGRKGRKGRGQEGRRKEEEREAEEGGGEQIKKDVTGWTMVTRSKKQKQRRAQIFVKVNVSKVTPMEVSLTDDKVEDVMRQVEEKDEDAYVTRQGKCSRQAKS